MPRRNFVRWSSTSPRCGASTQKLVLAVIAVESAFDAHAVSQKNAMGLMQLTADTAARFGVRDPFDPEQNIRGGTTYLRWLIQRFAGDLTLALAAYNAGENNVDYYGGVPPFAETIEYIKRIPALISDRSVLALSHGRRRSRQHVPARTSLY